MQVKGAGNAQTGLNVGKAANPLEPGLIISGIFVPFNWYLPIGPTDSDVTILANLQSNISALLINNSYAARAFYIGPFEGFTDKSEDTTWQTLGYGKKVKTQRRIITKEYQVLDGGVEYWRAIQSFTGKIDDYKWLEIDNQGVVYGTQSTTSAGVYQGMQGYRLSALEPQDRKQANKGSKEERMLSLSFQDSAEHNEFADYIETGIEFDDFVSPLAVTDVDMETTGLMVGHIVYVRALSQDWDIDLTATVPGMLVAANFTAVNATTGVAVGITSVSIVGNTIKFTFNTSSSGWVVGNTVNIGLASVSTLATAGYNYYECASPQAVATSIMVA